MPIALRFACRMNHVLWTTFAANHGPDFLLKSLVNQSINKGIHGRVEQNQRESYGVGYIFWLVVGGVIAQDVGNPVSQPTHREDDTDQHHHQSDSLPNFYNSLRVNIKCELV